MKVISNVILAYILECSHAFTTPIANSFRSDEDGLSHASCCTEYPHSLHFSCHIIAAWLWERERENPTSRLDITVGTVLILVSPCPRRPSPLPHVNTLPFASTNMEWETPAAANLIVWSLSTDTKEGYRKSRKEGGKALYSYHSKPVLTWRTFLVPPWPNCPVEPRPNVNTCPQFEINTVQQWQQVMEPSPGNYLTYYCVQSQLQSVQYYSRRIGMEWGLDREPFLSWFPNQAVHNHLNQLHTLYPNKISYS